MTLDLTNPTALINGMRAAQEAAQSGNEAVSEGADNSFELMQANDLLLQALASRDAASHHLADSPDDVQEADQVVALAQHAVREAAASRGNRTAGQGSNVQQLLSTVGASVSHLASNVTSHEAGSPSSANKKVQMEAAAREAAAAKAEQRRAAPISRETENHMRRALGMPERRAPERDDESEQEVNVVSRTARRAAQVVSGTVTAMGAGVSHAIEAGRDMVGDVVDRGRDAVQAAGRTAARARDAVVDTTRTATRAVVRTARNAGHTVAGTVRNVGHQVGEMAEDVSENVPHAANNVVRGAGNIANRAGLEFELHQVVGQLRGLGWENRMGASGVKFDIDGDGRIEVHELRWHLNQVGLNRASHIGNGNDDLTGRELTTIMGRLKDMPNGR